MSNETNEETKVVHGYKVFNPDWTCSPNGNKKQYSCPGKFEEDGRLDICNHGMHFCQKAAACFNYYDFTPGNKVAEVIAYGRVVTKGDKSCTDKLEIVRELTWEEVLRLVNTGYGNTGDENTGNKNTGNCNTGHRNTGFGNTGFGNTGDENTGDWNTGDLNTGDENTGDRNTGYSNTGNGNTGDKNTGNCNTGYRNTGYENTGNWNTGYRNTGYSNTGGGNAGNRNVGNGNTGNGNTGNGNTGDQNTGDWNKSSYNSGCFNIKDHTIMLFDKSSDWTYNDWLFSDAKALLDKMPKNVVECVRSEDMTDEEKKKTSMV